MVTSEHVIVAPSVDRIVEGLRDTGYDFNSAVADIVDNSIAARADKIQIRINADLKGRLALSIADNGIGMDREGLINAMRYGSARREDPASLGKFGLGLKTASTAFCRRLVVISRSDLSNESLSASWDLDEMARENKWKLNIAAPNDEELHLIEEVSAGGPGTVIVWEKIDRVLPQYKKPSGGPLRRALNKLQKSLVAHLAMVFQRFIDHADDRAPNVTIEVNEEHILPWDPFALRSTGDPVLEDAPEVELPDGETTSFSVRAFILPRQEEFHSTEERDKAKISNDLQGIYVYRENRLIHGPDWLQMYKNEPHFSLLRVELSFDHTLDEGFQVDIKKSRIQLKEELYDWLREQFLVGPRREAEKRYRKGSSPAPRNNSSLIHQHSDNTIASKEKSLTMATVTNTDVQSNEAEIHNNIGQSTTKIRIIERHENRPIYIDTVDTLEDGVLWDSAIINNRNAVVLNSQHPYYKKAYLPHRDNTVIVQALDFLLWSLAQAQLNNSSPENSEALNDFRIDVSRNLKRLVADLPDPSDEME